MKFKNINPLERHVEKATILVAAAAAAYFVYFGFVQEPNAVNGTKPGDVEIKIGDAVKHLQSVRDHQKTPEVKPTTYVTQYHKAMTDPLANGNLLADVPTLAPSQPAIAMVQENIGPPVKPIALPVVPVLTEAVAESERGLIAIPAPVTPNPNAPPPPPMAVDITYVQGKGLLQLAALTDLIRTMPRPELRHTAIYRIAVQRQEQHAGAWSEWVDVPPLPINPLPAFDSKADDKDFPEQVGAIRARVLDIIEPKFYPLVPRPDDAPLPSPGSTPPPRNPRTPPHPTPTPAAVQGGTPSPADSSASNPVPSGPNPLNQIPSGPIGMLPLNQIPSGGTPAPGGEAPAPAASQPMAEIGTATADASTLMGLTVNAETVPVWFWDAQAKPGATYRYRARLEIINPLYHLPKQIDTIPPQGRNQTVLASDWTEFKPITVDADEYFYLNANNLNNLAGGGQATASFKIYKWYRGRWVAYVDGQAEPGVVLGGQHLVVKPGAAPIPVDFGSRYTVVDVRTAPGSGTSDVQVVLVDNATGEIVIHDLLSDTQDPQRKKLEDAIAPPRPVSVSSGQGARAE